ncbi:MAG: hypothetical protein U9Q66_01305 [Patescibacteria group bacterium]|nr:hypothetical protein [Patescibacteria group bacterium]
MFLQTSEIHKNTSHAIEYIILFLASVTCSSLHLAVNNLNHANIITATAKYHIKTFINHIILSLTVAFRCFDTIMFSSLLSVFQVDQVVLSSTVIELESHL